MAKKASGLGRGLGDLLDDNKPEVGRERVVIRDNTPKTPEKPSVGLYDGLNKPKNKSLKSNYR